ncbi:TonB-dependent receptor [Candidatus Acidulodesulfobacterium sp. H_13]|uniref:TonB-dependent receptor n=1 Tax=Candidatus Acidulodesulfobacterium sp. H_13 TaxID=3395470 RepID=UPI003AF6F1FC
MKGSYLFIVATMIVMLAFGAGLANAEEGTSSIINSKEIILGKALVSAKKVSKTEQLKKKLFKSSYSGSLITKKEIKTLNNPMTGIASILSTKPSISASSFGPNGMRTHIEMRAFNSGQITESFDGIPLNSLFDGGSQNFASVRNNVPFTLGDVSSINIYRGINNPSVSSFNSLGGTINYNPLLPSYKANGEIFGGYGSYATRKYGFYVNTGTLPGDIRMYIRATKNDSNGWIKNTEDKNNSYYISLIKPYNEDRSDISLIYMRNDNVGKTPHSIPLPLEQKYGFTYNWPTSIDKSNNIDDSYYVILSLKNYVNKDFNFQNKIFYHNNRYLRTSYSNPQCMTDVYNNPSSPIYNAAEQGVCSSITIDGQQPFYLPNQSEGWVYPSSTNTYNPEALFGSSNYGTDYHLYIENMNEAGDIPQFNIQLPQNKITFGGKFFFGNVRSAEFWYGNSNVPEATSYNNAWNEHDTRTNDTLYVQDKIYLINNKLSIEPGIKYNTTNTTSADNRGYYYKMGGTESNTFTYYEPSVGISYQPLKNWIVYGAWGRIQKVPNISAYYDLVGSANGHTYTPPLTVKPEYVTDYELGTRYKYAGLHLSLNGYKELFENTFSHFYNPSLGVSLEYNSGNSMYEGIELALNYKIDRYLKLFGNWSYNTAIYTSDYKGNYGTIEAGDHIANVPRHLANIGFDGYTSNSQLRLWGTYTGQSAFNYINGVPSGKHYGGYWVFNVYLNHYFNFDAMGGALKKMHLRGVTLSLSIDNILNKHYNANVYEHHGTLNGSRYYYETGLPGLPRFAMLTAAVKF